MQIGHQTNLSSIFSSLLFVSGIFLQSKLSITRQISQTRTLFEISKFTFSSSQLAIDDANTFLNEFRTFLSHLILLIIGILIIESYKAIDKINSTLLNSTLQAQ